MIYTYKELKNKYNTDYNIKKLLKREKYINWKKDYIRIKNM